TSSPEVTQFLPPGSGTCECNDTEEPFLRSAAAAASEAAFEHAIAGARTASRDELLDSELEQHGRLADGTRNALIARHTDEVLGPAKARLFEATEGHRP
ncbi:MAG: hypothetical protein WCF10_18795, partial [Polyangiales bacterium]